MQLSTTTSMDSALDRAFDIPELAAVITASLKKRDITALIITNKRMHDRCNTLMFRHVSLFYSPFPGHRNIFESVEYTLSLARNIHHVRSLVFGWPDLVYYFNAVMAYLDTLPAALTAAAGVTSVFRPEWLCAPDPRVYRLVPIAPVTSLTTLFVILSPLDKGHDCPYALPSYQDHSAALTQVCWAIQLNPGLVELYLANHVSVRTESDLALLCKTIGGLTSLKTLRLMVCGHQEHQFQIASSIFFACPPSVEELVLDVKNPWHEYPDRILREYLRGADGGPYAWKSSVVNENESQEIYCRKGPLLALKEATFWDLRETVSVEQIRSIFRHCPNLTNLCIPKIYGGIETKDFARIVGEECPRIESLDGLFFQEVAMDVIYLIPEALPVQQLRRVRYTSHSRDFVLDTALAEAAFVRHSTTLSRLSIQGSSGIESGAIQVILAGCAALEELRLGTLSHRQLGQHILLADAVERPWACTRLRRLGLRIGLPIPDDFPEDLYCSRDPPIVLHETEVEVFQEFEKLYRTIGSLQDLEELRLYGRWFTAMGEDGAYAHDNLYSFPGMLSLGDTARGRPGYLRLLGGLKKLRILVGSVLANTTETRITMGFREAIWIDEHWPLLEVAGFFMEGEKVYDPFVWLQEQRGFKRPALKVSVSIHD
ncbi:MAG: hypothetical protein JOS17DRAFT_731625 [Linnemannia elongata]|nr:MAG: hypothetical protein JOS17DRAFT_731625 [Linnemannia elongata]